MDKMKHFKINAVTEILQQVHITQASKTGKLAGINSINTSTLDNEFCIGMMNSNDEKSIVCKKCYAGKLEKQYPSLHNAVLRNHILLSTTRLTQRQLPVINASVFRIASVGEIVNLTHALNLIDIINYNPDTLFAWWTKRDNIIRKLLKLVKKPANLILVFSSSIVDKIENLPTHFDKVFTAHSKNTDTSINCHGACMNCKLCYSHNDTVFINEIIK